jgi:RIO kinase 1
MIQDEKPILIDFSQGVLIEHPMAMDFLRRDLENLYRYFDRQGLDLPPLEKMYESVTLGAV